MSYYKAKSLKVDRKNNKVTGTVADSNLRDYADRLIYSKVDDLYSEYNTIGDKEASLYYDIICGNIHTSIAKYSDLVCSFDYFKDFVDEFREVRFDNNRVDGDLYNVYMKHKNEFDRYTVKNCVLRDKDCASIYVVRVNQTSISLNYGKENARKFNDIRVRQNAWYMENFVIEYI